MRRHFPLTPAGKPSLPDKVDWLHAEMLKTRVAHGYCARHLAAGACPYANICETCDNYVTAPEFRGPSPTNSTTSTPSKPTPRPAAGLTRPPATTASRTPSPTTCTASTAERTRDRLTRQRGPDKGTPQQGDPPTHRRRRDLPRPQRPDPARRCRARRTTRRMGRITPLPRPRRPQQIPNRPRLPHRTGGHPGGADRLNHEVEQCTRRGRTPRPWT